MSLNYGFSLSAITTKPIPKPTATYRSAGVDIDEADCAVSAIRKLASKTLTPNVLTSIGSFGAGFSMAGWRNAVLVSSADGVGTKLKVAFASGRHDTVGEDLVNHCVNDIAVQGATPLFFLDYFSVGKLDAAVCTQVVSGIARGCKANGCALIGGETAEMPGLYAPGEYDLAGFIVGAVKRKRLLTGERIVPGDRVIGLPSNGLHPHGYSLARKVFLEDGGYKLGDTIRPLNVSLADELLRVHRSYLKPIAALHEAKLLNGAAHITGGGLTDNIPRILPKNCAVEIAPTAWPEQPVFELLRDMGNIPLDDFRRTFNLGIGMVLVVPAAKFTLVSQTLKKLREPFYEIGRVVEQRSSRKLKVHYL